MRTALRCPLQSMWRFLRFTARFVVEAVAGGAAAAERTYQNFRNDRCLNKNQLRAAVFDGHRHHDNESCIIGISRQLQEVKQSLHDLRQPRHQQGGY